MAVNQYRAADETEEIPFRVLEQRRQWLRVPPKVRAPSSYDNPNRVALARIYSRTSGRMSRTVAFMVRGVGLGNPLVEEIFSVVSTMVTAKCLNKTAIDSPRFNLFYSRLLPVATTRHDGLDI